MIELKNEKLTVLINETGAELTSVKNRDGREYIWCGDPAIWSGHCPVLFPVCGRLRNGQYTYEGRTYSMKNHGFARRKTFEAKKLSDTEAIFSLREDEETLAEYPFRFVFVVRFLLKDDALAITYSVHNTDDKPLLFNFGSHEGFATDGNFEDWSVEFEQTENLALRVTPILGFLNGETVPFRDGVKELPLCYALFENDAMIFDRLRSRRVTLKQKGKPVVEVGFAGFDPLLLWTKLGAPYLCIEPWNGIPDYVDASGVLSEKNGIRRLATGETFAMTHTLRFF